MSVCCSQSLGKYLSTFVCSTTAQHKVVLVPHDRIPNGTPAVWVNHSFSQGDGPLLRDEGCCWPPLIL